MVGERKKGFLDLTREEREKGNDVVYRYPAEMQGL